MAVGGPNPTARLYTRSGDRGETGLAGGLRVAKDSDRIRAYGALDELASHLGLAEASLPEGSAEYRRLLQRLQHELFIAMSEVASAPGRPPPEHLLGERHVERLEREIDELSVRSPPLRSFVLPRGSPAAAQLHVARTVCRRAERELWALHRSEPVRPEIARWINRLSDLLFALALEVNRAGGVPEIPPDYST